MKLKEARKWLKAFRKAKFKCIVPEQVVKAMKKPNWEKEFDKKYHDVLVVDNEPCLQITKGLYENIKQFIKDLLKKERKKAKEEGFDEAITIYGGTTDYTKEFK